MLISIIIPTYNVERYVADALDSAIAQTYRPIEIIAIDNNSTDGTLAILHEYEKRFPDLIMVLQEPKQGAPAARNLGLRHAKGEWIQFLDADDLLLPEKVERQVKNIGTNKGVTYLSGGAYFRNLAGQDWRMVPAQDPIKGLMEGLKGGGTNSNLWARSYLEGIGGWQEDLPGGQDIHLMMELVKLRGSILREEEPLVINRERESGQISTSDPILHLKTHIAIRTEFISYLKAHRPDYYAANRSYLMQSVFRFIRMLAGHSPQEAIRQYGKVFPEGFLLTSCKELRISALYALLVNILGYRQVERTKSMISAVVGTGEFKRILSDTLHGKRH